MRISFIYLFVPSLTQHLYIMCPSHSRHWCWCWGDCWEQGPPWEQGSFLQGAPGKYCWLARSGADLLSSHLILWPGPFTAGGGRGPGRQGRGRLQHVAAPVLGACRWCPSYHCPRRKRPSPRKLGSGPLNLTLKDGQDSRGLSVGTREERKHRHGERAQSPGWGLQWRRDRKEKNTCWHQRLAHFPSCQLPAAGVWFGYLKISLFLVCVNWFFFFCK